MAEIKDPENTIIMTLKDGEVVIELLPDVAPKHSERMKVLARAGKYDNVAFHRVIEGFMAQTGADRTFRTCRRSSRGCRTTAARSAPRGRRTPTRPTASSSSISTTTIS